MGTKADWINHIENWQRSDLSQAAYCRQHDLTYQHFTAQLAAYRKAVKRAKSAVTAQSQPTTFIPVQVEPFAAASSSVLAEPSVSARPEAIAFCHAQGHRLELPLSVSAGWVAELLRCLA